jgi:peptidoglycan/LPS O-acetylase OafA/YrhL
VAWRSARRGTLGDRPRRWRPWFIPVGILGLILGSYPAPSRTTPDLYTRIVPNVFGPTQLHEFIGAHVVGAVLLLAAVVAVIPVRRPLETAPVRFLGRISFSLYIVHFIVLSSLGAWLLVQLQHVLPYNVNALLASAVVVVVSIASAWLFTRLIDEPTLAVTSRAYRALLAQLRRLTGKEPRSRIEGDSPATLASEPS